MKHFTDNELKVIKDDINNGTVYCGIRKDGYGVGRIYLTTCGNIGWRHFGESANKNTIEELRWMLETIFKDCETVTPAEWSDYHIGYVPIDKQYKGIDYSTKHPNVCGL